MSLVFLYGHIIIYPSITFAKFNTSEPGWELRLFQSNAAILDLNQSMALPVFDV
jgi:hypothetical protein